MIIVFFVCNYMNNKVLKVQYILLILKFTDTYNSSNSHKLTSYSAFLMFSQMFL